MKSAVIKSLGFELNTSVPESVEEYDQLAKVPGAALQAAIDNVVYRSVLAGFRAEFADKVEATTGIEREKDDEGNVVGSDKAEAKYFKRVLASLHTSGGKIGDNVIEAGQPEDVLKGYFTDLAQSIIAGIEFDPSAKERKSTSSPSGIKTAEKLIDAVLKSKAEQGVDNDTVLAKLAELFTQKLGYSVEATKEAVVKAQAEKTRREREAAKAAEQAELEAMA